jgi:hypothetical protein
MAPQVILKTSKLVVIMVRTPAQACVFFIDCR